jgi:hypothetical protein
MTSDRIVLFALRAVVPDAFLMAVAMAVSGGVPANLFCWPP